MYVLMGDAHIPGRASEIPEDIISEIISLKPESILWTGDLTVKSVLTQLRKISKVYAVKGNMDYVDLPFYRIIEDEKRILLMHGDSIKPRGNRKKLAELAKNHKCSLMVCGHTHQIDAFKEDGVTVVNPGSCTGVLSGESGSSQPSFATLDLKRAELFFYILTDEGLKRKRIRLK